MLFSLLLLAGCDDMLFPSRRLDTPSTGEGYCAVQALVRSSCLDCHSAAAAAGGLDLETDLRAATVGVASARVEGAVLVRAGDAAGSLLYRKITGTQAPGEGLAMPPEAGVDLAAAAAVRAWIRGGATAACAPPAALVHADGYDDPAVHGLEAKQGALPCVDCHGATLEGQDAAPSCDTCHPADWRTDCTFCHGDPSGAGDGAPPVYLDGSSDGGRFRQHMVHVSENIKAAYTCDQCHQKPADVLSPGHVFVGDATPGIAEVDFTGGLSPAGVWAAEAGSCSNLYCHGDGQGDNGAITQDTEIEGACDACHPAQTSPPEAWESMSGMHKRHLGVGIFCGSCHDRSLSEAGTWKDVTLHVNGSPDYDGPDSMTATPADCTGSCHAETHEGRTWY